MISLLCNVRVEGNPNHNLGLLLDSLAKKTKNTDNIELLIKYDLDDVKFMINHFNIYPFSIASYSAPRWRGYADLHLGVQYLMQFVDERSTIVGAVCDDFETIMQDWDEVLEQAAGDKEYFILHARKSYYDMGNLRDATFDEVPFWSKKLIYAIGNNFHTYALDAYSIILEHYLKADWGIDIGIRYGHPIFDRKICGEDTENGSRYVNEREEMFKFLDTLYFRNIIKAQAENIALRIGVKDDSPREKDLSLSRS